MKKIVTVLLTLATASLIYEPIMEPLQWREALAFCRNVRRSDLAAIKSVETLNKLKEEIGEKGKYFWVAGAGHWHWTTKNGLLQFVNKKSKRVSDQCGAFSTNEFALGDCLGKLPFIC